MGHVNAIMVYAGADANAHINQLRLELENAEVNSKQEALAVGIRHWSNKFTSCGNAGREQPESFHEERYVIEH